MKYGTREFNDVFDTFKKGKNWLNDVSIEIEGGENEVDPLVLLRAYDQEPDVDNSLGLATQFVMGKHIKFYRKDEVIYELTYTGGDLGAKFAKAPYLLDLLLKMSWGLMVKKLTPPSEVLANEERL